MLVAIVWAGSEGTTTFGHKHRKMEELGKLAVDHVDKMPKHLCAEGMRAFQAHLKSFRPGVSPSGCLGQLVGCLVAGRRDPRPPARLGKSPSEGMPSRPTDLDVGPGVGLARNRRFPAGSLKVFQGFFSSAT